MNAVDTNVLVYAVDQNEPIKQAKAERLLAALPLSDEPTFLPWQVLCESIQQFRRWREQGRVTDIQFDQYVQATRQSFPLLLPSAPVIDHALDLASRYSLSHWDSMLLGACKAQGITTLYTYPSGDPRPCITE